MGKRSFNWIGSPRDGPSTKRRGGSPTATGGEDPAESFSFDLLWPNRLCGDAEFSKKTKGGLLSTVVNGFIVFSTLSAFLFLAVADFIPCILYQLVCQSQQVLESVDFPTLLWYPCNIVVSFFLASNKSFFVKV